MGISNSLKQGEWRTEMDIKRVRVRRHKLTPDEVISIRRAYWRKGSRETLKALGEEYNVSLSAIWQIVNGTVWNWLPQPSESDVIPVGHLIWENSQDRVSA